MFGSRVAVLTAIVAVVGFAVAAVLFVSGNAATERLGLLFALLGTVIPALVAALRSDQAAASTNTTSSIAQALNGGFEARVRHSIRAVANETGTKADAIQAAADASTAQTFTTNDPLPPNPPVKAT